MSRVYACWGGPFDGKVYEVPDLCREVVVPIFDRVIPLSMESPVPTVKDMIREGRYVLTDMPQGRVLRWQEPT